LLARGGAGCLAAEDGADKEDEGVENARLRRAVCDLTLDKRADAAKGNS